MLQHMTKVEQFVFQTTSGALRSSLSYKKPSTIWRNCQREEWTQKLVRLSQKQRQAVVDNMKFCYWRMTVWSCPSFCCPVIPVPQIQMLCTAKAQETAVRSQQEHTPFIIRLVIGLKFWVLGLLDETEHQSSQRNSLNQQLPVRSILLAKIRVALSCRRCYCWILVGATEAFGRSFPGHLAIRCSLVRTMLCDCQIWGTTGRFKSFHIILSLIAIPCWCLVGKWPCCWNMKSSKRHDGDSAPSLAVISSGPHFGFGPPLGRNIVKDRKDH